MSKCKKEFSDEFKFLEKIYVDLGECSEMLYTGSELEGLFMLGHLYSEIGSFLGERQEKECWEREHSDREY